MKGIGSYDALGAKNFLRSTDALSIGHFVGTQTDTKGLGWHMTTYVDKTRALMRPDMIHMLSSGIAFNLLDAEPDTVLAPPMGAIIVGAWTAMWLGTDFVFPERDSAGALRILRAPYLEAIEGKRVAVVEDIINSGQTTAESIALIRECGGEPVAVSAIWNRGGMTAQSVGVPLFKPLIDEPLEHWTREECLASGPCSRGVPVNRTPGHGASLEQLPEGAHHKFV